MSGILVGISGGVDSSVAAVRLKQQGQDVSAAYIKTWANEYDVFGECPADKDIAHAQAVCEKWNIPFEIINLVDTYFEKVVQYMVDGYRNGITPNPDIMCNREIKFGAFLDWAIAQGFDSLATGHYCQKVTKGEVAYVTEGKDPNKDQSYFLAMVEYHQIERLQFPVGDLEKPEVRELAKELNLPNATRKDSQGICFLGKVNVNEFLRQYIPDRPGEIVSLSGKVLGEHKGLHRYTIGQRKGIGIPSNNDFKAYVVIAKDLESNQLIVAFDEPMTKGLYCDHVQIHSISNTDGRPKESFPSHCRVRYRDPKIEIRKSEQISEERWTIHFTSPQRAIAPGQVMAFYEENRLMGGAVMIPPGLDSQN